MVAWASFMVRIIITVVEYCTKLDKFSIKLCKVKVLIACDLMNCNGLYWHGMNYK